MCSLERHLMQCLLVATNVKSMLVIYGKYRIPRSSYSLGALSGRRCDQALHYKVPRNNSTTTISIIQAGSKIIFVRNEPHNPRVLILSHWAPGWIMCSLFMSQKLKGMDWRRITFGFKARGEEYGEDEFLSESTSHPSNTRTWSSLS